MIKGSEELLDELCGFIEATTKVGSLRRYLKGVQSEVQELLFRNSKMAQNLEC